VIELRPGSILFIRHAERDEIPPGSEGSEVPLTDRGRAAARALGRQLGAAVGDAPLRAVSSPVGRCMETASLLLESAGRPGPTRRSMYLANAFIEDPALAYSIVNPMGYDKAVWKYIDDGAFPGFTPLDAAASVLMGKLREYSGGETAVCVSHDVVILPFLARYCPECVERLEGRWIGFLQGAVVEPDGTVRAFHPGA